MIEIEHLLFLCAWLILYFILQFCTWLTLRAWLPSALVLPASFAISLLCSCLISWYLAWLGFSPTFTLGIFLLLTGIVFRVQKAKIDILSDLKEGKWYYVLFFIVFSTMLVVRMFQPYINGSARFMNHAFIASIMRTPIVPPLDPWFAGGTLDIYYYLGHWCFATLGMMAHIPSWMVVQFVLPTVVGISAVLLYGIGKMVLKKFSLLPVICLFIVNPAFIYFYLTGIDKFGLFWTSSRVIPYTITEYPLFAFLFGDVHAHTMGVFNQLFFILLIVYLLTHWQKLNNSGRVVCAIVAGISLGTMLGMNVWDALSYGPVFVFAAIIIWYQTHHEKERDECSGAETWFFRSCMHLCNDCIQLYNYIFTFLHKRTELSNSAATILYLWILVPFISFLSYAPFFLMMNGGDQGIGIVYTQTTLPEFFLMFGWFLVLLLCTLYLDIKKQPNLLLVAIPFLLVGYPLIGFIVVLLAYLIVRRGGVSDFLLACGLVLTLFCEIIYIINLSDGGEFYRRNTVFKLYFAAWFLLGIGSLCSASIWIEQFMDRVLHGERGAIIEKYLPKLVVCGVVLLVLSVPILNQQLRFVSYDTMRGLDGYGWMEITYPDDYAAVMYLRELSGEYVLVEAESNNMHYGRISSATGIPTILGWSIYYESTWRGDNPPGWEYERKTDISMIYEQPERAAEIMEKYNANLLILGAAERERYQVPDDFGAYLTDLVPVFTGGTMIYQRVEE